MRINGCTKRPARLTEVNHKKRKVVDGNPITGRIVMPTCATIPEASQHIRLRHDEHWESRGFEGDLAYQMWGNA